MTTDFSKPVVTDAYATLLPGLVTANKDLARMLEPGLTGTSTNIPTGAVRWNATTIRWERYNGTSWVTLPSAGDNLYAISVSGNAATATSLATARTIGGVSFNGTADINLPGVNASGNQSTTGNAATATKLAAARTIGGVSFDGSANINLPGVNATGNQNTTGNAATASAIAWSGIASKPTTVAGYGISDMGSQSVNYANTAGNGGVTSVNGSTGAVVVSVTPTTAAVLSANAGATQYAIGTYARLGLAASNVAIVAGTNYTGLNLYGLYTSGGMSATGIAPGTWKAMTACSAVVGYTGTALFLRIA